jgi:ketosteroid isomerase-like protein
VEVEMPWFPDFVAAVELARVQTRAAGRADPVGHYLTALAHGDDQALEAVWPGDLVVHDPRAGVVRGHKQLRQFVRRNQSWLAELHARAETVASTRSGTRAVVELMAHLVLDGTQVAWPVAVVAESPDDRSVTFRTYCSQWPLFGRHQVRPAILQPGSATLRDVVARYFAALDAGDAEAAVGCFARDGYLREPIGPQATHRGATELRSYFTRQLSAGRIGLRTCALTDDGQRCAVEYTCVAWGGSHLPPQAGLGVYERGGDGLLAAVRLYDDIEPPAV